MQCPRPAVKPRRGTSLSAKTRQREEKGPAARRRPKSAPEAYFLYVEGADEAANEADGPFSCPDCGTRDTWEARQGGWFRGIVGAIDACPSLEELAGLGKRLYGLPLTYDQAGVVWSHYRLRKQALEAHVALGKPARALLAAVEQASPRALGRVGARLYRTQHAGAAAVTAPEWRRIWQVYQARRAALP